MNKSKTLGNQSEDQLASILRSHDINFIRTDETKRDFIVKGIDIEVKATSISQIYSTKVKNKKRKSIRIGQFTFNKEQIKNKEMYVALFINCYGILNFIGFIKNPNKQSITLHQLINKKIYTIKELFKDER